MKKKFLAVLAVIGLAAIPLAGCNGKGDEARHEQVATGTYSGLESTEAVYGVAAVTTAKLLETTSAANAISATAEVAPVAADSTAEPVPSDTPAGTVPDQVLAEAEDFNKYFNMLDTFLDKGATKTVVTENTSSDEAVSAYEFKLTVTGKDVAGKSVEHVVYFTETKGEPKTVQTKDKDGDTETVVTTVYTLEGAVKMGETEQDALYYFMTGARTEVETTETDGWETETERVSTLIMKSSAVKNDLLNYVLLTHTQATETEENETESESLYTYQIFENGVPVETTAVGFEAEQERGETEEEYTVAFQSGTSRGFYTIERETKNGRTEIVVAYRVDGKTGVFGIVKNADGTYRYRFGNSGEHDEIFPDFDD